MPSYRDPSNQDVETGISVSARDKYEAEQWMRKLQKVRCPKCFGKGQVREKDVAGIGRFKLCPTCGGRCYIV